jgi:hypothetical protein
MRLDRNSFSHRGKRGRIFRRGSAVLDAALVFPILAATLLVAAFQ